MHERIISTKGVAESLRVAKTHATRLIAFPDGITRHITLPGWQWAVLDRFDRPNSFVTADGWLELAFEATQNDTRHPDQPFEAKLRYFLSIYLEEGVCFSSDYIFRRANDC